MSKWALEGEIINNKIEDIDNIIVMVNKKYISKLKENNIPYFPFSEEAKECQFIRMGKKKKRFNEEECQKIKDDHLINGKSYRKLAKEYECSTKIIYQILKDKY
ncbi:hypothetical protein [Clostridium perfringens]|jgi:Mor family transcriptional regulator|uniref:hypothetical protein n=1 Tax=Clostridium perfringens TaxID=1502 RepID=UPI0018E421F1|nr:hypothetical protein [Clostridium perfringens]MBI6040263.1 hypothetical protein [Clostridium perfringens]